MDFVTSSLLAAAAGYVLGSISFAVLIARAKGKDIFTMGSGNPGATNVLRNLGKPLGYACFLLDALKGFAAAGWPLLVFASPEAGTAAVFGLIGAIVGHSFSVFIGFRGGKGVATTIGGLLAINPLAVLVGCVLWLLTFFTTRYVSLASILLALSLPVSSLLMSDRSLAERILVSLLGLLIVLRHRSNIARLLKGEEHRFARK